MDVVLKVLCSCGGYFGGAVQLWRLCWSCCVAVYAVLGCCVAVEAVEGVVYLLRLCWRCCVAVDALLGCCVALEAMLIMLI